MPGYPVSLNLHGRECVVVGGGIVAERKVRSLIVSEAQVVVISRELCPGLAGLYESGSILYRSEVFEPSHLDQAFLVIAATDNADVNSAVYSAAKDRGILINVADCPAMCTFLVPATVRRGDLSISVSTSGKSPALAHSIREGLEIQFGVEHGDLVELMGELRDEVKAAYNDASERRQAFVRILDSDLLAMLSEGDIDEARKRARLCI